MDVLKGRSSRYRQAKLVRPLALGLADGEVEEQLQKRLVDAVENYRYRVGTGFLSTPFILFELTRAGRADAANDPNGEALLAKVVWHQSEEPLIGVSCQSSAGELIKAVWRGTNALPTWSWRGCRGRTAAVEVHFDAAQVELLLNGKSLG